ncbi:MAG: hypothetical protein KF816_06965 [Melioribacteraceae bacterium]|nr:hypothetical protein [Melioribacteraceae bacterium]
MKVGLFQYSPIWEAPEKNIELIEKLITKNTSQFDLIIFPELTLTGFTMNSQKFAEDLAGISHTYFMKLASKLKTNIFAGLIEYDDNKIFNSLVHFDEFGLVHARYRKVHPFSMANETRFYNAGNELVITEINKTKIGLSVCYDLRFPELYRLYAKEKVDLMINIANWPIPRIEHWKSLLKARAIENQFYMIGVNRTGDDPKYNYCGASAVFDPMGTPAFIADENVNIFEVDLNLEEVLKVRNDLPFLNDMKLI